MAATTPLFNVSFTRSYSIPDGVSELSDVQIVAARLFTSYPSETVIEDDTSTSSDYGFIERVTSWASGNSDNEKVITYSAITDPDPHNIGNETYYEVLNVQLETGGPEHYEVRPFTIKRAGSLQSRLYCVAADITDIEYKIGVIRSSTQINTAIAECEERFIFRLRRNEWERHRVLEGDYNRAFRLFCTAQICRSLSDDPRDIWSMKYQDYMSEYEEAFSNDPIHEDTDGDGNFTDAEIQTSGIVYFDR